MEKKIFTFTIEFQNEDEGRRDETQFCAETEEKAVDVRNSMENDINGALQSMASNNLNSNNVVRQQYMVRRLTPLECERLQGLPDGWTYLPNEKSCSDSARYKAIGNGMAQPCADWIIKRIVEEVGNAEMETEQTDA